MNSRHFVGAWAKSDEINQANKERLNYKVTNYERKNYLIGTNFRVALIPRFANLKRREKKNPADFNVAKFNILLYSLFSQFNEETYVYVLCIMCKSFMACLQMTNNCLTVKFYHLRCFEPLRLYRYRLYRYRRLQVLSAPVLYSRRNGHLSRVFYNLKRQPVYSF